ncbi:acyltransferase family protein [Yersinia frederiksenii]|uniref:acyltransferase family protein n=1 Tax=Yersinia frederiksenii TaxID=29484 RepID=UPI0009C12E78|nr:acyltransferase [Yersinia frederiksenii]
MKTMSRAVSNNNKLNPWLDICRAMAIMFVIVSHGRHFLTPSFPFLNSLKFTGFLGVELFFILSGFLIGRILINSAERNNDNNFSWIRNFWARRWIRTYPNYFVFILINILLIYFLYGAWQPDTYKYFVFAQALITPHPSFFAEAWSLAVEEIFYLTSPVVIWALIKLGNKPRAAILITVMIFFFLPLIARGLVAVNTDWSFGQIRSVTLLRLDSIMIGVFVAWVYYEFPAYRKTLKSLSWLASMLFFYTIYVVSGPEKILDDSIFYKIFLFDIANIGCAGIIVIGLNFSPHQLVNAVFSRIARWSYAAYLTNLPVYALVRKYLPLEATVANQTIQLLVYIFFTLFSAFIIYTFFERRVLIFRDKVTSR